MGEISRRSAMKLIGGAVAAVGLSSALGDPRAAGQTTSASTAAPATMPAHKIPPAPQYLPAPDGFGVAPGPFQPTWESLSSYVAPEWYRDAKLGIWAHWGPQCQPEMGDWYAQKMYMPNDADYKFHVQHYGHPSKFGFKDVINEWKADKWKPDELIDLYVKAGAKYFAAMAHHHDNLDNFDSTYQPWNSVKVGPKKDIVGGWMKAARARGLRFAITSHGDRAWSWYQAAQNADTTGPLAGVPYDGIMTKDDGKGLWWEGIDPQDLYAQYHAPGKYPWTQTGLPALDPHFIQKYFNRIIDLINKYQPDLLYFDDTVLPIYPTSDIGLRIAAYLYNTNLARNGKLDVVMTGKGLNAQQRKALVLDVERGVTNGGETLPWQTDTCIGGWHYQRSLFEQHKYKKPVQVVQMLVDIVSKNGNLMLNIPVRGDGTIDDDEVKVLQDLAEWIKPNGEAIYATRPWKNYGEGPSTTRPTTRGRFGGSNDVQSYTAQDIRFTTKGDTLYAIMMGWPGGQTVVTSIKPEMGKVQKVEMLGHDGELQFTQDASGLKVTLPSEKSGDFAWALKISGLSLQS